MKLIMLSGAYKNAGDFLIERRCGELLRYVYPGCEITRLSRQKDLTDLLPEINDADAVVITGGPALLPSVYPTVIPLVSDLRDIKPPLFAMALGIYAMGDKSALVNYKFNEPTQRLWRRIEDDGFIVGCRDVNSANVMNRNGFLSIMTGCAAWYDLENVESVLLKSVERYEKILVSDPASTQNYDTALNLLKYLRKKFPEAKVTFAFHRGTSADEYTPLKTGEKLKEFADAITKMDFEYKDISYSADGFNLYDDCDLHIGFRVHAHIYTLSKRRKSILISEDLRGEGFDQTVGLPHINAKKRIRLVDDINPYIFDEIDDVFTLIKNTNGKIYEWAFQRMRYYFDSMITHIKSIGTKIN